ncbi:MAG: RNA polymerase sigma factor [Planctomycetaceae bacterium]
MPDDATLVQQAIDGDRSAFGLLYDRYAPLIRALCFRATGNLNCAQELAQDVFLRAFVALPKLQQPERFAPWLVSIAQNGARGWRRSRRRDRHRCVGNPPETIADRNPHDDADTQQHLRLKIARLPQDEQLALDLYYLQDQPAEVARSVLGLSHSGFHKLLARARERLAEILSAERETIR